MNQIVYENELRSGNQLRKLKTEESHTNKTKEKKLTDFKN